MYRVDWSPGLYYLLSTWFLIALQATGKEICFLAITCLLHRRVENIHENFAYMLE